MPGIIFYIFFCSGYTHPATRTPGSNSSYDHLVTEDCKKISKDIPGLFLENAAGWGHPQLNHLEGAAWGITHSFGISCLSHLGFAK